MERVEKYITKNLLNLKIYMKSKKYQNQINNFDKKNDLIKLLIFSGDVKKIWLPLWNSIIFKIEWKLIRYYFSFG